MPKLRDGTEYTLGPGIRPLDYTDPKDRSYVVYLDGEPIGKVRSYQAEGQGCTRFMPFWLARARKVPGRPEDAPLGAAPSRAKAVEVLVHGLRNRAMAEKRYCTKCGVPEHATHFIASDPDHKPAEAEKKA